MKRFFCLCALSFVAIGIALAGEAPDPPPVEMRGGREMRDDPFAKGAREFQVLAGGFRFFDVGQNDRPSVDFLYNSLRFGIMLDDPHGSNFLAGNFELLGEVFGGSIVQGPGSAAAGATLIFRYNFIQPRARIVPYFQIGTGGVYTDITEKDSGGLVSLPVEFNLQGLLGVRYLLNDRWSLVLEGGYRHISNAGIHEPNVGIDTVGGNVGFGFSF